MQARMSGNDRRLGDQIVGTVIAGGIGPRERATEAVLSTPRPLPGSKVSVAEVASPFQVKLMDVSPSAS